MRDTNCTLSAKILSEIEGALQDPPFLGIPMGSTINDALITEFCNSNRIWNKKTIFTNYMRYYYHRFRHPKNNARDFSPYAGRVMFTWLFNRIDLKRFVMPLINTIGAEKTIIFGPDTSMASQLPPDTVFGLWNEFPKIDMRVWRKEYDSCSAKWHSNLNKIFNRHGISSFKSTFIMDILQIETQLIMSCNLFLDQVRPKAIVTEYDRNGYASCLILAAKGKRIPTITMIHGALEPYPAYGFAPLLADIACCWGERHKTQMMEYGISAERLIITGCQRLSRTLEAESVYSRELLNLPSNKPFILLATNPISPKDKKHIASIYCSAVSEIENITAIVRLHPAEILEEYQELMDRFPKVKFFLNSACAQDESLAAADIVVNQESGFGNDALIKGKFVIIMDVLQTPLKNGQELIDLAGCPSVKNAEELAVVIRRILSDKNLQEDLHNKSAKYVQSYCSAFGQEAADNIICEIDRLIASRNT